MAERVAWVHDYAMRATSPALRPGWPGVFVFDEEWIESEGLSLKRLVFLYECALELPVTTRRGRVVEAVSSFAREAGAGVIVTTACPSPRIARQIEALRREFVVEVVEDEGLVGPGSRVPDLKRFSRYWSRVERSVFEGADRARGAGLVRGDIADR